MRSASSPKRWAWQLAESPTSVYFIRPHWPPSWIRASIGTRDDMGLAVSPGGTWLVTTCVSDMPPCYVFYNCTRGAATVRFVTI